MSRPVGVTMRMIVRMTVGMVMRVIVSMIVMVDACVCHVEQ